MKVAAVNKNKELGCTILIVDFSNSYKASVLPTLSADFLYNLMTDVETTLKKCLQDQCLGNIQTHQAEETRIVASWESLTPPEQAHLAIGSISELRKKFIDLNSKYSSSIPRLSFRIAVSTTCKAETGRHEGQFDVEANFHHAMSLLDVANSTNFDALISSETHNHFKNRKLLTQVLEPMMRITVTEPLPIFTTVKTDSFEPIPNKTRKEIWRWFRRFTSRNQ